ncbi:APG9-domain-containing protein [Terfezia boudieri ATCC MYA-4762]|uniref:Autophagy-related protein 9 n=1 Tax=Terfezia boudieri ATCC MYA-4762 TaxID=1051890 RepID=A0A3N4MAR2_9PEZI|nr:APG9-domain-containing protein [Terfezia boudieri ATCC MYA-4762]
MLSRLGKSSIFAGGRSLYETLRQQDDDEDSDNPDDLEAGVGMSAAHQDEELEGPNDYELRPPLDLTASRYSQTEIRQSPFGSGSRSRSGGSSRLNYMSAQLPQPDTEAEEVPASLLVEGTGLGIREPYRDTVRGAKLPAHSTVHQGGPVRSTAHAHWVDSEPARRRREQVRTQEEIHQARIGLIDPKQRALWKWANVESLDNFLHDVYQYYVGNGIYSICLHRFLNMMTSAFIVGFTVFLFNCVDYSHRHSHKLSEVVIAKCTTKLPTHTSFLLWLFAIYWVWSVFSYIIDFRRLRDIQHFYYYLLEIPESDMQTISWQEVVQRLMVLRDANPTTSNALRRRHKASQSKERMDAHDIANRLMRKENYLIALFNKDILDISVPFPILNKRGNILTKALTWNIEICVMDYVFNPRGQLRPAFLKESERKMLSDGLRRRFVVYAWANLLLSPLIASYLLIFFFMRYYAEFTKNPGQIGHRQYTPLAEWKFREFNELWHIFEQRINMSYPFAERYVDQFPKDKTVQLAKFVHFIACAFAGVLAIAALVDPELITNFEITPGGTIVFWIGILGTVIAVARGMIPEEKLVYDPEEAIKYVINYTHYMPNEWNGKLHSDEIKQDFMQLYGLKVMIFFEELLSVITTPFVMWFSLYYCSDKIIDFFREFTIHVDGIGYVCSYAVFDFKRNGAMKMDARSEQYAQTENKMLSSYWGFLDQYGPNNQGGGRRRGAVHPHGMSPILQADEVRGNTGRQRTGGMSHSIYRGHHAPINMAASATASVLLDAHHQPPPGAYQRRPYVFPQPTASLMEEDEYPSGVQTPQHYVSNLGEPFLSGGLQSVIGSREDDPAEPPVAAGVLGLLNQFQRVQGTGGGRGGVNI